jgi:hypothetical protein
MHAVGDPDDVDRRPPARRRNLGFMTGVGDACPRAPWLFLVVR